MPGTFVIDTGGVVRFRGGLIQFAHRNKHVADSPANDDILDVVSKLVTARAQPFSTGAPTSDPYSVHEPS